MSRQTNSKNSILESALQLFSERGYDAVGVAEIVRAAGITKPTLYHFFQSKEGVFKAILEEGYGRLHRVLRQAAAYVPHPATYEEDVQPVLLATVRAYFRFAEENPSFYRMALSLFLAPQTESTGRLAQPYEAEQYGIMKGLFEDIAAFHTNLRGKEASLAISLMALANARIALWYRGQGSLDGEAARNMVHQFMHGIFS
ncbi:TetR/AcrR family transcriptional regulator [Anaerotalea alkaliphila]|uniref:TetR/AcrR family transcriptional regulator n=1 Tax=Anaerotalea alkaliphila TaxID=2662126 RepID=A0A7X5HY19_9FIRM|nr:TetR/AcrR family transcriptional regulator [Anaerotalea alkaliphila]NDL68772.1 TetR/AcrR family transcriptional regulator [Anaerotalea alkaliphila]